MKPKSRSLISALPPLSRKSLVICASLCASGAVQAQSGTWNGVTSGGNWSDTGNWAVGVVADGSGNAADLSTANLPAGVFSVNLDTSRTIGSINFGDSDIATSGTWTVAGLNTLTLAGVSPTLSTGVNTRIDSVIAGAEGFTKSGAGDLILTNSNTLTGGILVTAGRLVTKNSGAAGSNAITLSNGTSYRYERTTGNAGTFQGNAINLTAASTATITTDNAINGYSGVITADANSTVNIGAPGLLTQVSFNNNANTQQFGGVLGTVKIADGGSIRFSATSGVNNGGSSATFDTSISGDITTRNSATVNLGALIGTGTLTGSSGATGTAIFSVGAKGIDSTFGGVIRNNNTTDRLAALTKVGPATLTLTGTSTYTGATNVSAGTLLLNGALGNTAVAVASGATIGGDGSLGGNLNLVSGANFLFSTTHTLDVAGAVTFGGFGIINLLGLDHAVDAGTYTLINGNVNFTNVFNVGVENAYDLGNGKSAYLQQNSLQVVVIPEPSAALLGGLGLLALLRRRRSA